jgi:hypothetical protein
MDVINEDNVMWLRLSTVPLNGGSERNFEELGEKPGRANISSSEWLKVVD